MKNLILIFQILLGFLLFSCKDETDATNDQAMYWFLDINDGKMITTSDEDGNSVKSTVRFVVRGYVKGDSPEGDCSLDITMYNYMSLEDNDIEDASGYYSGSIYWQTQSVPVSKLLLGIVDDENQITYSYGSEEYELPFFNAEPGNYYIEAIGDDGTRIVQSGQQAFMLAWPESMKILIGGSNSAECNTVEIYMDMIDQMGLTATDLYISGNVYKFNSKAEMDQWVADHPEADYSETPKDIPF